MTDSHLEAEDSPPLVAELALMPLLQRVAWMEPRLRKSERKVATVVLADPTRVLESTMAQLAAMAEVSEPTVMRFCLAVNTDGFHAFRLQLAKALALGLPPTHSAIGIQDDLPTLIAKVFDHTITSLDRARRTLDPLRVAEAVSALTGASSIFFIGLGASGIVAQDAQQKFPLFGVPCEAYVDEHQQFMVSSMSGPEKVCVAISNTGRSRAILRSTEIAKARGATVIGITGEEGPLFEGVDIPLLAETFEDTDAYTPTTSRLAALAVVDILATGVAMRRDEHHLARLREMKRGLADIRSADRWPSIGTPQPCDSGPNDDSSPFS